MDFILQPWHLLHLILAGWVNQQQQHINDYLRTENQILREKLGQRRILLDDDQRPYGKETQTMYFSSGGAPRATAPARAA